MALKIKRSFNNENPQYQVVYNSNFVNEALKNDLELSKMKHKTKKRKRRGLSVNFRAVCFAT